MERKFYTDNFEQLLKEKSDEFRMYPSKRVWHSIYNDLHPGRKWPSVAVSMVLIIALLMVGYWNNKSTPDIITAAAQKNIHNTTPSSGFGNNGAANNAVAQTNSSATVTNSATAPNILQGQSLSALNSGTTLFPQQNERAANKNDGIAASAGSVSTGYSNPSSSAFTEPLNNTNTIILTDHTIAFTSNGNIAEYGTDFNNVQKPVSGNNADGNFSNTGNDKDKVTSAIAIAEVAAAMSNPAVPSFLQQNGKALVSADLYTAVIIAAKENTATVAQIAGNKNTTEEEENITASTTGNNDDNTKTELNNVNSAVVPPVSAANTGNKEAIAAVNKESKPSAKKASAAKKITSADDKEWIEDYAFHNKSKHKKWQDRTAFEFYITPGAGFSKLTSDAKYNLPSIFPSFANGSSSSAVDVDKTVKQKLGWGFEAGFSVDYSLAKKLVIKAGIQANYTSYGVNAYETNHPILTTLMFVDPNTDFPYLHSALTTLSNIPGSQPVVIHNRTYQVSIPLGFAYKVAGNTKLAWYAGATIQPTLVAGGKAYLISADRNNYVADVSLIRKWNLNTGIESYITYKFDNFTLQAGPQFRYQLFSTYYKKYTVNETLSNVGIKIGLVKTF